MQLIFLTGMPGSGKSYWGKNWAAASGWTFRDMDQELSARTGLSIARLFEEKGEAYFRLLEQELLHQILESETGPALVATGGGVPVYADNMDRMKAGGCVVYLSATVAQLSERLLQSPEIRPLLQGAALPERLGALLVQREAIYRQAHRILPVESISNATFAEIQTACINRHSLQG